MIREEVDQKYLSQANELEVEFFDIVNKGLPSQHRVLKDGKSIEDFNQSHSTIWSNHEAELIAEGFMKARVLPEPVRDPLAEIDRIEAELKEKGIL